MATIGPKESNSGRRDFDCSLPRLRVIFPAAEATDAPLTESYKGKAALLSGLFCFVVEGLFQKLNLLFQPRNIGLGELPRDHQLSVDTARDRQRPIP